MCWHRRCSPVAKALRNGHIPLTSFAPVTVLVPHAAVCHTVEVIQSENNFLKQSCCQEQDVKQTSELAVTQHSQTSSADHPLHFLLCTDWLFLVYVIPLPADSFLISLSTPLRCIGKQRKCYPVGLTDVWPQLQPQAAGLMIWATFSTWDHWKNIQGMMHLKHIGLSEQNYLWLLLVLRLLCAFKSTQLRTLLHTKYFWHYNLQLPKMLQRSVQTHFSLNWGSC